MKTLKAASKQCLSTEGIISRSQQNCVMVSYASIFKTSDILVIVSEVSDPSTELMGIKLLLIWDLHSLLDPLSAAAAAAVIELCDELSLVGEPAVAAWGGRRAGRMCA